MILKVNKDICEIKQNEVWNVGDYNVHTVQVELSEEFDGLVNKVRYFTENNSYDMLITDNIAEVPYEATLTEGTIKIGVYGYDADTNILVQSTSPVNKYISSGTYTGEADNTEPLTPTDKEQMESQIQANTNDIAGLKVNKQDTLISGENIKTINDETILGSGNIEIIEDDPIFKQSPAYTITDNDITYWNNKANVSDIPDVSNFITKDVDNLTYYTKSTDMQNAIDSAVNTEKVARENADVNLQNQIDAITVSSDVIDILGTYQDLQNYDTSHVKANDIIKILQDSTHNDSMSYYRWVITDHVGAWVYVGSEGPYYTKSESDVLLNTKQNEITSSNMLASDLVDDTNQTNQFVTTTEKTTWNNKLDQSDLTNYVKNTDYASSSTGGVIKTGNYFQVNSSGQTYADTINYSAYQNVSNATFISKGTLENVITGKNLETSDNKVTSISSSSTDVQYPSAKCVYDNDVIIKDDVNTKYDYLFSLTNLFGKITGTGTSVTLNDTSNTIMKLNLDTTTSSQGDNPTPSNPQAIHTINGNNTISIAGNIWNQNDPSVQNGYYSIQGTFISDNNYRCVTYKCTTNDVFIKAGSDWAGIVTFWNNETFVSGVNTDLLTPKGVIDIPSGVNNVRIVAKTNTTNAKLYKNPQEYPINLGDIELCKIGDYQDVLFKNTLNSEYYDSSLELNKWYKLNRIGKKVLNGSEGWYKFALTYSSSQYLFRAAIDNLKKMPDSVAYILSDNFKNRTYYEINNSGLEGISNLNNYSICCISARQFDDYTKEQFETWLSNNNTTIYYPLETPSYTLLNDTLQTQLNALQYAMAYDNQTNISQTNTDLGFAINAETFAKIGG